jgi:DNA-3-methyladenine glycosylase
VETEAYASQDDPACHTRNRPSARDFIAAHLPGTAYVYLNYGMHWLLNFVVKGVRGEGFVLIRALEPVTGSHVMQRRRKKTAFPELCNGPAKLTQSLGINGTHHGSDPLDSSRWTLVMPQESPEILVSTRIGISRAKGYPWRFLLAGNPCVSVKP